MPVAIAYDNRLIMQRFLYQHIVLCLCKTFFNLIQKLLYLQFIHNL